MFDKKYLCVVKFRKEHFIMTFTNNYDAFVPEIWGGKLNAGLEKIVLCFNVSIEIGKVI